MIDANRRIQGESSPEALDMPAFTSVNITAEGEANSREVRIHVEGKELLPTDFLKNPGLEFMAVRRPYFHRNTSRSYGQFYAAPRGTPLPDTNLGNAG